MQCEEESMSPRLVWLPFIPEKHCTASIFSCLMLMMSLSIGDALAQDSLSMNGMLRVDGSESSGSLATEDALRERVAREGWMRVRVDLIQSARLSVPSDAVESGILEDQLERTTQDLLFALPAGSYEAVHRDADSPTLTLRVDAVGLDELLVSPLVANVDAAGIPGEAGMDLAIVVEQAIRSYQLAYTISPDVEAAAYSDSWSDSFADISLLEDLRAEIIATLEQLDTGSLEARDHLHVVLQNLDDELATDEAQSLSALPATTDAVDYRVDFIPSSYSFGQVPVGSSSAPQTATIRNIGTGMVTFERGILNYPYVSAGYSMSDSTCGATLSPGTSCEVKIRFSPQATGSPSAYLFVRVNESTTLFAARLDGTGTADRTYGVGFTPSSYSFGQVPVGSSSAPQTATIRNTGTGTVTFGRGILN
ncbi:choice-of-anchor D domain-containing protein [Thiocapsa marina]|nr:choice-of-anchor D domain-containing protein [Thiocapsa marina]